MTKNAYNIVAKNISEQSRNLTTAERKKLQQLLDIVHPHFSLSEYTTKVNYDLTIEQLIKNDKYDWYDHAINSLHFPSNEKGMVEVLIFLINFDEEISSDTAVTKLDRLGLRPATLKELLALNIAQPDLQQNNPIVALGSKWLSLVGRYCVPRLYGDGATRSLALRSWNGNWFKNWQFAAVQK